jgi:hypothetical protein
MASPEAREVDVGQGDRVARARSAPGRPVGQVDELVEEGVLALLGLEDGRTLGPQRADPPSALGVAARLAGLHLDGQEAVVGVGDDQVGFAIDRWSATPSWPDPADVRVEAVLVRRAARRQSWTRRSAASPVTRRPRSTSSRLPGATGSLTLGPVGGKATRPRVWVRARQESEPYPERASRPRTGASPTSKMPGGWLVVGPRWA